MRKSYFPKVKSLFVAVLLIATTNCTRDDFSDIQQIEKEDPLATRPFQINYLSADQAPVFVKEMFPSRNRDNNVTSSNNYTDTETGAVFDEQTIMKVTDTLGNTNYTIRFGFPHTPERIFYNLIVGRDAQGVMNVPYIVRYVSDSTAFDAFKNSRYDFRKFRGKITYHKYADFFGTDKSLIGDLVILNRANSRSQTAIDTQTACEPDLDEFGDPIACETITLSGGTSGSSGGSSGSGDGLNPGDTAGTDSGVDSGSPPGDGSTSGGGSDGTGREQEDPIDPVGGDSCCNTDGGATLDGGVGGGIGDSSGNGGGTGAGCLRWVGVETTCDLDGQNCVSVAIYVPVDCSTGKQLANSFEECPECTAPADGGVGVLPPKTINLNLPCLGDPIKNPVIVSSGGSGKKGGTFGCTRKNKSRICNGIRGGKEHDGVDIKADPFESIYAIKGGIVVSLRNNFGVFEYKKDSYGNYVEILSIDENGNTVKLKYNHLGNSQLKLGDLIEQGSVIGLAGKSGNAAASSVRSHVHIQAKVKQTDESFKKSNPLDFFASNSLDQEFNIQINPNCN